LALTVKGYGVPAAAFTVCVPNVMVPGSLMLTLKLTSVAWDACPISAFVLGRPESVITGGVPSILVSVTDFWVMFPA
jgi:hypothetical protein